MCKSFGQHRIQLDGLDPEPRRQCRTSVQTAESSHGNRMQGTRLGSDIDLHAARARLMGEHIVQQRHGVRCEFGAYPTHGMTQLRERLA
jgi:hypothetical protein